MSRTAPRPAARPRSLAHSLIVFALCLTFAPAVLAAYARQAPRYAGRWRRGAYTRPAVPPRTVKPAPAPLAAPGPDAVISPAELRPGMTGYGLTVFKGTKIERFDVTVLGVLPNANNGRPLVLVRMSGGPITARGAYLIQGMSGSPVYVNNRLVGAFAYGNSFAKEPIGMVTPIGDMMEALDQKIPTDPIGLAAADVPLPATVTASLRGAGPSAYHRLLVAPDEAALPQAGETLGMAPIATPVVVSGFSPRRLAEIGAALRPFHLLAQSGAGRMEKTPGPAPALVPGAGIGVSLITGDMDMTAIGTVTWRKGDRILAFGHPFMQLGAAPFPVTTVWVHDVFAGYQTAFKIASPVKAAGTLVHDRPFSIMAKEGALPPMVPVTCSIDDQTTGRKRVFHVRVANHPLLVGQLAPIAIHEAIAEAHPVPDDVLADVNFVLDTDRFGPLKRENCFYDPVQIEVAATQELSQMMSLLASNTLQRVPVRSLDVNVILTRKHPTAAIERVFVKQDRFEPGETVDVGVVLRPYRGAPVTTSAKIQVPEAAASGRAVLVVSGGSTRVVSGPVAGSGGAPPGGGLSAPGNGAATIGQLLRTFFTRERNNQLVTRILFPSTAVSVDGVRLSGLPANLAEVMRSSRITGLRLERDEAKVVDDSEYLLQGAQALPITIEKKDVAEKPASSSRSSESSALAREFGGEAIEGGRLGFASDDLAADPDPDRDSEALSPFFRRPALPGPRNPAPAAPGAAVADAPEKAPDVKVERTGESDREKSDRRDKAVKEEPKKEGSGAPPTAVLNRQPVIWRQAALEDFQRGTLSGTAVTTTGEVRLAPAMKSLAETGEQYVWSLVGSSDAVYAGTGNTGLIYRIAASGKADVFCKTGELEVHALVRNAQGDLFAGTSPAGKVLRVAPDGKVTELLSLHGASPDALEVTGAQPAARFVLSLALLPDGAVLAGTAPDGAIHRVAPDGKDTILFTAGDGGVTSLIVGPRGEVYAGTAGHGLVYRIEPGGRGQALLATDQTAVSALARDGAGNLYVATTPKGIIYRIAPDGSASSYFNRARSAISALSLGPDDVLYAACANLIYRIESSETVTALSDSRRANFMALAWDGDHRLVAGSANVGTVYHAEPAAEGAFESTVHDAKTVARWGRMRLVAVLPPGGQLIVETRSGNTPDPDAGWSDWAAPRQDATGSYPASPAARYLQYRVRFHSVTGGAAPGVAALREISVITMPRNEPPAVTLSAPSGGEIWRGKQPIRWTGTDPNKDTLSYEVSFSADGGATWKPIGVSRGAAPAGTETKSADQGALLELALKKYRDEIGQRSDISPEQRQEMVRQAEAMVASYKQKNPGGAAPKTEAPRTDDPASPAKPAGRPGVTRESSITWDTTQVPDGIYMLKVVASDRPSNPSEPLTAEKESGPVIICNQPPVVFVMLPAVQYGSDHTATVTGLCQGRVTLKGAEYRVDDGEWTAIDAADGIWDSGLEQWRLTTEPLTPGDHAIQVKAVDSAGNVGMTQATLKIP